LSTDVPGRERQNINLIPVRLQHCQSAVRQLIVIRMCAYQDDSFASPLLYRDVRLHFLLLCEYWKG
jgi:hypothetical protein